jgi:Secretion system C-terminal sorting domain
MASFEGWRGNDFNLLTWVTSTERDHQYFEVERSDDGIRFSPIGRVAGAINSSDEKRYSFKDEKPLSQGYYRLKQVDSHNNITYSYIVRLFRPVTSTLTAVFENPVHGILKTNLETSEPGKAQLRIVDVSGKTFFTESVSLQKGNNKYQSNLGKLTPGTYYLVIIKDDARKTFPFIKF